MKKKNLRIGGAAVLVLGGTAGVASAQYQTTNFVTSNIGSAPSDFIANAQLGIYSQGTRMAPVFNTGNVTLAGSGYGVSELTLIDSNGASSGGLATNGVYGNTDAVLDFTLLGTQVVFAMAERINNNGSWPVTANKVNTMPVYLVTYDNGTLDLFQNVNPWQYSGSPGTSMAQQTGISLAGGTDTYQLEMSTQGSSSSPTITVTLSQNSTVVGNLTASGPGGGYSDTMGEVGFAGGSSNWNSNVNGIVATSFSVNETSGPAHSALLSITANATSIGGYLPYSGTQNPGGASGDNVTVAGTAGFYAPGSLNQIGNGNAGYAVINGFTNSDQQIVAVAIQVTDAGNASFHDLAGNATKLADVITDLQASPALSGVSGLTIESFAALQSANPAAANFLAAQDSTNGGNPLDIAFLFTGSAPASPEAFGLDLSSETVDGITAAEVTDIVVVPEPASISLLLLSGLPLIAGRRRPLHKTM